jgi:dTDP-4-amino-4,6-dideoxygalactose transaminase
MNKVEEFERLIADFYGAPYAVATDCCTHAIELCLRMRGNTHFYSPKCPKHTYLSVPMTFMKLGLYFFFEDNKWEDYYYIDNTNIIDAAVYWKKDGYVSNTFMCLSFQYKKHLSLGRGGMILCDNHSEYQVLKKMSYDGRLSNTPWADQNVDILGFHYYMTPETAQLGIERFETAVSIVPRKWTFADYPDLSKMKVFRND